MSLCTHPEKCDYCLVCGQPQTWAKVIKSLNYIAEMSRTHDYWEIVKDAPKEAKEILEVIEEAKKKGLVK